MTIQVKHAFQSALPDGSNGALVQPSNWNDDHQITIASGKLVGRLSPGDGPAEEIDTSQFVSSGSFATVATTGDYADLTNKPALGTAASENTTAFASAAQGALADTALQPEDGALVPNGGTTGQILAKASNDDGDTEWIEPSGGGGGGGDMEASVYDPGNVADDAFHMDNMVEGATTKIMTADERTKLSGIEASADVTDAANVASAGAVMASLFDANTILAANSDNAPGAVTVAEARLVGRSTGGNIAALDAAAVKTILGLTTASSPQFAGVNIGHASDTTLTRASAGKAAVEGVNLLRTAGDETITGGFASTPINDGTKSSGTFTPTNLGGNIRYYINGGAHTLAPPSDQGVMMIQVTNNGSAGAITTSGFTRVTGDTITTTNGHDFFLDIRVVNGFSQLHVTALQ